jgi:hypothetical protein
LEDFVVSSSKDGTRIPYSRRRMPWEDFVVWYFNIFQNVEHHLKMVLEKNALEKECLRFPTGYNSKERTPLGVAWYSPQGTSTI